MFRSILRRVAAIIPVLLIVIAVVLLLVDLSPGDPAVQLAGENATLEQVERIRTELNLDRPVFSRYVDFLGDLVRGDLGRSMFSNRPVADMIAQSVPITASLALFALTFTVLLGVPAGLAAGLNRGGIVDRLVTALSSVALALPGFVVALVLVVFFAVNRSWLPATDYVPMSDGVVDWARHMILPGLALSLNSAAEVARQVRGSIVDTNEQDYIRVAKAKGLPKRLVIGKHLAKNAAIPVVTVLGVQIGRVLGGAVIVEQVFAIPGFGSLSYTAVTQHDYPLIQGVVLVSAVVVLVVNLLTDLSYHYFNPKLRSA